MMFCSLGSLFQFYVVLPTIPGRVRRGSADLTIWLLMAYAAWSEPVCRASAAEQPDSQDGSAARDPRHYL